MRLHISILFIATIAITLVTASITPASAGTYRFNRVTNVEVDVNNTGKTVVTWDGPRAARKYQVRLYQSGDLLKRDTVTTERKRFAEHYFDEGESYRIWVRVKATDTKLASRWRKVSYTVPPSDQSTDLSIAEDDVYITTSSDGTSFTDNATATFTSASVPDVVRLTEASSAGSIDDLLIYYVDFSNYENSGDETIAMSRSTDDGTTWSTPTTVTITGFDVANEVPVDPSIVQLTDGSLRMYFYGFPYTTINEGTTGTFYSATSTDGVTFTVEAGERFSATNISDPEVIFFQGQWILYYNSGSATGIATSSDGLTFTASGTWEEGGVPGAYVNGSTMYLYGCGLQGIHVESSTDGTTFTNNSTSALIGPPGYTICDPGVTLLSDNRVMLVYKKSPTT